MPHNDSPVIRITITLLWTPFTSKKMHSANHYLVSKLSLDLIYLFLHLAEDYQELTQREESDLEYMISQTENAISNIEAFTEQLSKDLSVLDGVIYEIKILI